MNNNLFFINIYQRVWKSIFWYIKTNNSYFFFVSVIFFAVMYLLTSILPLTIFTIFYLFSKIFLFFNFIFHMGISIFNLISDYVYDSEINLILKTLTLALMASLVFKFFIIF